MTDRSHPRPRLLGGVLFALGLILLPLGGWLLWLGGSAYYLAAGAALLYAGRLVFRGDGRGGWAYLVFFVITVVWALWEKGLDPWPLLPRLGLFAALGVWFLLPRIRRRLFDTEPQPLFAQPMAWGGLVAVGAFVAALWMQHTSPLPVLPPSAAGTGAVDAAAADWHHYGSTQAGTRFAPHDLIRADNVAQLERAWVFRTGVAGSFKATPLQIDDGLYFCTGRNIMVALDADSGEERWRFDPKIETTRFGFWDTCRGLTYYQTPGWPRDQVCAERLFTATTDARLVAVDRHSGKPCTDFGVNGRISLLNGMGEVKPGFYYVTSPPTVASGVLVIGGWVVDNQEIEEPSGVVRGFDPVTGALVWAWDMGREDRRGLPAEGESYTRGTPNVWSLASADDELGLVYLPTGNATPDYFGGHRSDVMDRYASSIVALDARTGRMRWHYQTTHHDVWDYDVPSQPSLVDVPMDGVVRKAVVVPTKRAELFLLDRETGEPLADIEERPTPQTDVPMEWTSPTQPFSTGMPSFARPALREADMWGVTPVDQLACRIMFNWFRYEGPLTPPSLRGSIEYPGIAGGMNWGSVAVDVVNQLMVVNAMHMPFVVSLIPREDVDEDGFFALGGRQKGTPYAARSLPFLSPLFTPCLEPPYGEIGVVDLASRKVLWRRPLGTAAQQGPLGIKSRLPLPMGMFYEAGSLVTGGGLIFNGGVKDRTFRGIDLYTGEELWSDALPASAQATPMSYVSPKTGEQYVVLTVPGRDAANLPKSGPNTQAVAGGGYVIAYRVQS